jgi:hypothetical protein
MCVLSRWFDVRPVPPFRNGMPGRPTPTPSLGYRPADAGRSPRHPVRSVRKIARSARKNRVAGFAQGRSRIRETAEILDFPAGQKSSRKGLTGGGARDYIPGSRRRRGPQTGPDMTLSGRILDK